MTAAITTDAPNNPSTTLPDPRLTSAAANTDTSCTTPSDARTNTTVLASSTLGGYYYRFDSTGTSGSKLLRTNGSGSYLGLDPTI